MKKFEEVNRKKSRARVNSRVILRNIVKKWEGQQPVKRKPRK